MICFQPSIKLVMNLIRIRERKMIYQQAYRDLMTGKYRTVEIFMGEIFKDY
jgi:hypothetical protein